MTKESDICKVAIDKITDEMFIAEIAMMHIYRINELAIKKITDQNILAFIAKTIDDGDVCRAALEKITDKKILAEIAKTAKYSSVRKRATSELTDQMILIEIAKTDKNYGVHEEATENITDQKILTEIAKTDNNDIVHMAATDKIKDIIIGQQILENASNSKELVKMFSGLCDYDFASKCRTIPSLSDISDDIYRVIKKNKFHNTNPTHNKSWQRETIREMEKWKISAQILIEIAKTNPERLIPIWDRLYEKINYASCHGYTQKQIGTYETVVDGNVRALSDIKTNYHTEYLELTFPDLPEKFKN